MLTLIFSVVLVAFVVFLVLRVKYSIRKESTYSYSYEEVCETKFFFTIMSVVLGAVALFLFIAIYCYTIDVVTEGTIDDKIEMYQEENQKIEQEIDKVVKEYLAHEHETFADLKTEESSITLVTLFPELKSDTLVQRQLEIYVANNAQIKRLKEGKIDIAKKKWLLYFGR